MKSFISPQPFALELIQCDDGNVHLVAMSPRDGCWQQVCSLIVFHERGITFPPGVSKDVAEYFCLATDKEGRLMYEFY